MVGQATRAAALAEHRFRSMGTDVTVLAPADRSEAGPAVARLFAEWDRRLTRFDPQSELMGLNARAGSEVRVSPLLFAVVTAAVDAARATDGLFDPLLLGRLVELGYDRTFAELRADPHGAAPLREWQPGEWRAIALDPQRRAVRLPAGSGIDLGGIAKGMAVDAALSLLVGSGMEHAAVNAGGDLAVHGLPPGEDTWPILIEGGDERVATLRSGALATTSVLRRRWWVDGRERHHLIDPRTGQPSDTGLVQASVAAASCRQAEVAAKAALLLGPVAGVDFVERRGLAALLVTSAGEELRIGPWD